MKRTSILTTVAASVLAGAALFATAAQGKDEPVAQNVKTVWIDGKGQSTFAEKVNKMHAEMEAQGWKFGDMQIYTENGDMKGVFVTYVR